MAEIGGGLCAKCGACTVVCPVFQTTGREPLSARGRLHLLDRLDPVRASKAYAEILSQCLLCGACRAGCPRGLDPPALFLAARARLERTAGSRALLRFIATKALGNPPLLAAIAGLGRPLLHRLPADSGLRLRFGLPQEETDDAQPEPEPSESPSKTDTASLNYFPGCYATWLYRDIFSATAQIVKTITGAAPLVPNRQCCCGLAAENAGDQETAKRLARQNIEAFSGNGLPILTSCASCYHQLRRYPELFADDPEWAAKAHGFAGRIQEFSTFASQNLRSIPALFLNTTIEPRPVFYHDPCHLRFRKNPITSPAREIIRAIPGLILREADNGPQCCGQGGLFHLAWPEQAGKIRARLLNSIAQAKPEIITTTCTGCLIHIQQGIGQPPNVAEVTHLALLLAPFMRRA